MGKVANAALSIGSLFSKGLFRGSFSWLGAGIMLAEYALGSSRNQQGPRLRTEDLAVQLSQEGADLPRGWGTWRQAGTVVYSSHLLEHAHTEDAGGKGSPNGSVTNYSYSTSMAIMGGAGPISRINRIWADNKVVYDSNQHASTWQANTNYVIGDTVIPTVPGGFLYRATTNGKTGPTEPSWPAGPHVTVADSNGVDAGVVWSTESVGQQQGFTLTQNLTTGVWSGANPNASGAALRIYIGTMNQPVDSYLETVHGVGKTSAMLGHWYIVFENFQLEEYGNRVPNFTAEVAYDTNDLPSIVTEIASWANLASSDLDLTELSGVTTRGFVIPNRRAGAAAITELMNAYSFRMAEVDGVLRAILLAGRSSVLTLADKDLRWQTGLSTGNPPETTLTAADEQNLNEIQEVQFYDVDREYNAGYRYARRQLIDTRKKSSLALNLALKPQEAQDIAERMLGQEWEQSRSYAPLVAIRQLALSCGDVVTIPTPQGSRDVILSHLQLPLFGAIGITAPAYNPVVYAVPIEAEPVTRVTPVTVINYTLHTYGVGNWPSLRDSHNTDLTVYAYACSGYNAAYQSTRLRGPGVTSANGNSNFIDLPFEACVGSGVIAQSGDTGEGLVWDRTSTVTVDLVSRELSSVADEAYVMENDAINAFILGNEIMQFKTATYDAGASTPYTKRYVLSDLLRGRRGTEVWMDAHSGTEDFVLLDGAITPVKLASTYYGRALEWQLLIHYVEHFIDFTPDGTNMKPYQPLHITGAINLPSSGDVTLNWDRQSRYYNTYLQTGAESIVGEPSLRFEVDVLAGDNTTVLRTITSSIASVVYTNAQQVADFGSLQSNYNVTVYQMGTFGRGYGNNQNIVPE